MVVARFDPGSGRILGRETLFTIPPEYAAFEADDFYDVSPDGERFLMVRPVPEGGDEAKSRYILVQNFFEELKARVPN